MIFDPAWKTGHLLGAYDPNEAVYKDHPELAGAALVPSDDTDFRSELPSIRSQIDQDCCAHGASILLWFLAKVQGITLPFGDDVPSFLHLYANAQIEARPGQPLANEGSSLKHMFAGAGRDGVVAEADWPEIQENVGVIPPDDLWRTAERVVIQGSRRLSDGMQGVDEIKAALRRKRLSTICLRVDEKFGHIGPNVYTSPGGLIIGSHCMLTVGYVSSIRAFIVRNSWGTDFGDVGYALVHEDVVARLSYEKYTFDLARFTVR